MYWDLPIRHAVQLFASACGQRRRLSSLDLVRSSLVHDADRKLKILRGQLSAPGPRALPPAEVELFVRLIDDLELALRAHARWVTRGARTWWMGAGILADLSRLRRLLERSGPGLPLPAARSESICARLQHRHSRLGEALTEPYAERLTNLAARVTEEIQAEVSAARSTPALQIVYELADPAIECWIARSEAERWKDLLRNLLRNAVHATEERWQAETGEVPPVRLSLRARTPGQVCLEVVDRGVGMSPAEVERIWTAGESTHGVGRGQGLTEEKRRFLADHAVLEVRSREGVGTAFVIDIPKREVPLSAPPLWRSAPAMAAALILALAASLLPLAWRGEVPLESVELADLHTVRGVDAASNTLWTRQFADEVQKNDRGPLRSPGPLGREVIARRTDGRIAAVCLATSAADGPGAFWLLRADGKPYLRRTLRWTPPKNAHLGRLICWWRVAAPWPSRDDPVAVLHLRDTRYAPSATLFHALNGDSLGGYYHPGHLTCRAVTDLDGDGRTEILLVGINNPAAGETTFVADDPDVYIDCLSLLEFPRVSGQAWPYRTWPGMEPAHEEGYLLLPPLAPGIRPEIYEVNLGGSPTHPGGRLEVVVEDGRIYVLDSQLRPIACRTGDNTIARDLLPAQPMAPLLWFHGGSPERVVVPIEGWTR